MNTQRLASLAAFVVSLSLLAAPKAAAHCDTLDGPVVEAARLALEMGDVTPVLKWVNKDVEKEIRDAFDLTVKVRSQGEEARKLADKQFFETLVRVHRAGEGVAFTGLKPAGSIEPGFQAADKALEQGNVDKFAAELTKSVQDGLHKRFAKVVEAKKHADESVEAGRAYVAAYVDYAHYVEALHNIATQDPEKQHHLHNGEGHKE
jgi:hypothetical protein